MQRQEAGQANGAHASEEGAPDGDARPVTYERSPTRLSAEELLASWPPSRTRSGEWAMSPHAHAAGEPGADEPPLPERSEMDES